LRNWALINQWDAKHWEVSGTDDKID